MIDLPFLRYFRISWEFIKDRLLIVGRTNDPALWETGDIDAFLFTFLDNLANLVLTYTLLVSTLGMDAFYVQSRVLPACGIALGLGSLFYWWQGRISGRNANNENSTGRVLVTSLPFGTATPSQLAFISLILLPVSTNCYLSYPERSFKRMAWRQLIV